MRWPATSRRRSRRFARPGRRRCALQLKWAPLPANGGLPVDVDATILIAHSDKEDATPTYKRTFGHVPLLAPLDYGEGGTGEPLAVMLRPGRANANNAADNIAVLRAALTQLPEADRGRVLVRTDAAGGTHAWPRSSSWAWSTRSGSPSPRRSPPPSVTCPTGRGPRPAYDGEGIQREGADVAELTTLVDLADWPPSMRVIVRRERPHSGAQLRVTEIDGNRITCFVTKDDERSPRTL